MGVHKREGIWQVEFQYRGQQVRQSAGPEATKQQATELETQLRKELADHHHARRLGAPGRYTFGDVLTLWLSDPALMKRDHGLKSHIRQARPHLEHELLSNAPAATRAMVTAFTKQGLKQGTINRRIAVVTRCISIARMQDPPWVADTFEGIIKQLPANNERFVQGIDEKQLNKLARKTTHREAKRAFFMAAWTGLRKAELLRLAPEHYKSHTVRLWSGTTKSGKWRVIPVHPRARKYFKKLPLAISPQILRQEWEAARTTCGLAHVQFRDLRHVFATTIAEAGGSAYEIQQLLGHSDIRVSQRYVNLVAKHLRTAVDRIE